jgi:hypothetical protein
VNHLLRVASDRRRILNWCATNVPQPAAPLRPVAGVQTISDRVRRHSSGVTFPGSRIRRCAVKDHVRVTTAGRNRLDVLIAFMKRTRWWVVSGLLLASFLPGFFGWSLAAAVIYFWFPSLVGPVRAFLSGYREAS